MLKKACYIVLTTTLSQWLVLIYLTSHPLSLLMPSRLYMAHNKNEGVKKTYKQLKGEKETMDKAPSLLRIGAGFLLIDVLRIGNCT